MAFKSQTLELLNPLTDCLRFLIILNLRILVLQQDCDGMFHAQNVVVHNKIGFQNPTAKKT